MDYLFEGRKKNPNVSAGEDLLDELTGKKKKKKEYYKLEKKREKRKERHLRWQMQQAAERRERERRKAAEKEARRAEAAEERRKSEERKSLSNLPFSPGPIRTYDPESTSKTLQHGANVLNVGLKIAGRAIKNKLENRNKKIIPARVSEVDTRPRLPGSSGPTTVPPSNRIPPSNFRLPSSGGSGGSRATKFPSLGQRARRNPELKKRLIDQRNLNNSYEYELSCWREEFLYELGDMRRNKRERDEIIDVLSGRKRNNIVINPTVTERYLMEKNIPTNPKLWAQVQSWAKSRYDVHPSAYSNGAAAKRYKKLGGGWKSQ